MKTSMMVYTAELIRIGRNLKPLYCVFDEYVRIA